LDEDEDGRWLEHYVFGDAEAVLGKCKEPELAAAVSALEALWWLRDKFYEIRHRGTDSDGSWDSLDLPVPIEPRRREPAPED
jgi:hypothetical protein